jgi:hypothetical protein
MVAGEMAEAAESNRVVAGGPVYRSWPEIPQPERDWIAAATTGEIVARYRLQGKDPERQARQWKKYAGGG